MAFRIRERLRRLAARLMRPGVAGLEERLDRVDAGLRAVAPRLAAVEAALDGLASRLAPGPDAGGRKYEEELRYWCWLIKTEEGRRSLPGPFADVFGRWQRDRLRDLGEFLGLQGDTRGGDAPADDGLDAWCAEQSVVEVGCGPYPAVAAAPRWRRAVALDPLIRGYAREGLLPPHSVAGQVTFVEAGGERIPLPDACADLVIIENALDHVSDPAAVVGECRRLLRDGGLLWLLVDLSTHRDPMHPHPFDEERVRALLAGAGFEVVKDRVSAHHSHPKAYGEYRGLLRRPGAPPDVRVVVKSGVSASGGVR